MISFHDFDKIPTILGRGAQKTAKITVLGIPGAAKNVQTNEIHIKCYHLMKTMVLVKIGNVLNQYMLQLSNRSMYL